jgi:hypothetical protein
MKLAAARHLIRESCVVLAAIMPSTEVNLLGAVSASSGNLCRQSAPSCVGNGHRRAAAVAALAALKLGIQYR